MSDTLTFDQIGTIPSTDSTAGPEPDVIGLLVRLRDAGGEIRAAQGCMFEEVDEEAVTRAAALRLVYYNCGSAWATVERLSLTREGRRALGEVVPVPFWFKFFFWRR